MILYNRKTHFTPTIDKEFPEKWNRVFKTISTTLQGFSQHVSESLEKKTLPAKMYVKNIMPLQNKQVANIVMLDDDDLSNGKKR
jgi:hypothetical protein